MPFGDVMRNLGDAIAGVDRTGMYIKGQQARADLDLSRGRYDETQAATEASMELAKQRRIDAEIKEQEKLARERLAAASAAAGFDPASANVGDIAQAGLGSDWSGAMQGRNYGQQYQQRQIVGTPEGVAIGDDLVTGVERDAAMDALAPGSAVTARRPRAPTAGAPILVDDGAGGSVYVNRDGTPFNVEGPQGPQPARPGARPPTPRAPPGPTREKQNYDWMVQLGIEENEAFRRATRTNADLRAVYTQAYNEALKGFATPEEAHQAGLDALEILPFIEPDVIPDEQAVEDYGEGEEVVNPETGQRVVVRDGVWVDVKTGQPVQ